MPYKNEHAARIKSPGQYDSTRRQNNKFKSGIHAIFGIKGKKSELQSIRFSSNKYTVAEAKQWLTSNNIKYIKFEPAINKTIFINGLSKLEKSIKNLSIMLKNCRFYLYLY